MAGGEAMNNPFRPTHRIVLEHRDGTRKVILVQLVDGVAYTKAEWDSETRADWECVWNEEQQVSEWLFQGEVPSFCFAYSVWPV